MPLLLKDGIYTLHCLNEHPVGSARGESTMQRAQGWRAIVGVHKPSGEPRPRNREPCAGTAVVLYACAVCGYVEMYLAANVEPEVWG